MLVLPPVFLIISLQWRHNERYGILNHQRFDCLLNRFFRPRSKKRSKQRDTDFCEGNWLVTDEFAAQRASNAENVSIWWRHHVGNVSCELNAWLLQSCLVTMDIFRGPMDFKWGSQNWLGNLDIDSDIRVCRFFSANTSCESTLTYR